MKSNTPNARLEDISRQFSALMIRLRRYRLELFLVFVICIYGLVIWRINTMLTAQPTPEAVTSQVKANGIPQIDPAVVQQLQNLRDNSVNVQVLFDQGRNNPFQ
ncbi:MAG TPA: hypothetical protein VFH99_02875 [Candidatus Saccharimonadales bacterium]|nr:hypothetical protein [Candidatus Saccharimonadales bacterium]